MAFAADSALVTDLRASPNLGERRRPLDALVLHYTGMASAAAALERLCNPAAEVSAHYLIHEDGRITQLVPERSRAWHAGRSYWAGERDMNSASIGLEIANGGHDGGLPPYPAAQIDAVVALCRDIMARHAIAPTRVLAHSDIAPERKQDPGERFPWSRLAAAGLVPTLPPAPIEPGPALAQGTTGEAVRNLHRKLARHGFEAPDDDRFTEKTAAIVAALQRRYRPARIDGVADAATLAVLDALLALER